MGSLVEGYKVARESECKKIEHSGW